MKKKFRLWLFAALVLAVGALAVKNHGSAPTAGPATTTTINGVTMTQLHVQPDGSLAGYSRAQFGAGWGTGPDGCDTRIDVLIVDGTSVAHRGCTITSGRWVSLYDGVTVSDYHELDIDHIVPLADAWRTGAASWSAAQRQAFANDPVELVAVTAHSNRSKGDQPPPGYEPPDSADDCAYAQHWMQVKIKYGLSVNPDELHALAQMSGACSH